VSSVNATPGQIRDLNELGTNLNWLYQFGVGVWIAYLIGKVYRFGIFKGCAAEIISGILFVVLIFGFFCCAPSLLASLSSSAIR